MRGCGLDYHGDKAPFWLTYPESATDTAKLDTDGNRDTAVKYGISSIPTVILLQNGEAVKSFQGMQPEAAYADEIDKLIA